MEQYTPRDEDLPPDFPRPLPDRLYRSVGCRECRETGFSGRTGIYELLCIDNDVRRLCIENVSATQIRDHALKSGMKTLRMSGWEKVLDGVTDVNEVKRISKEDI